MGTGGLGAILRGWLVVRANTIWLASGEHHMQKLQVSPAVQSSIKYKAATR